MTIRKILDIIINEKPNAKILLYMFGGIHPKAKNAVNIAEAKQYFDEWLDYEVKTMYNGTFFVTADHTNAESHYSEKDLIVLEYWG